MMVLDQAQLASSAAVTLSTVPGPSDVRGSTGFVRAFQKRDIPRVCELFSETFRLGKSYRADDLAACIEATYFTSPAYTEDTGSIVHVDEAGQVDGFFGVIAISMQVNDTVLRGGILSAYMAADPDRNPGIGVSLARGIVPRGFDILIADTANRTSLDIARAQRFMILPAQSLEWVKIFRPAATGLHFLGKRLPRVASWLAPLSTIVDGPYQRFGPSSGKARKRDGTVSRPIDAEAFVEAAAGFVAHFAVKPAWTRLPELAWFVAQAGLQTKYGPLRIREVLDSSGRRVGLYLLYARRDGVAYALQVLAKPNREELVVARLIDDAAELGAAAVRGSTSPDIMQGLVRQNGIFYHHVMGTTAWGRDPATVAAIRSGNILIGGLAGETWARIVTEDFS